MDLIDAVILGVVQGLTEFLPVSSSGHLEIGKVVLRQDLEASQGMMMAVVLHGATALATVVVFYREIIGIFAGLLKFSWNEDTQFIVKILVSMIPAVAVGLLFEEQIESLFDENLLLVGAMLLVTGGLLLLAGRAGDTHRDVGYLQAAIIGISQAVAILPGISRSGATISTSVLAGIDRERAARFSFLMVVPLILGKMAKDALDGNDTPMVSSISTLALVAGFLAAFVTGLVACKWMIVLVKNCQLWWFSIYCFVVGMIAIGYGIAAPAETSLITAY